MTSVPTAPRPYGGQAHLYDPEYAAFDQDVAFLRERLWRREVRGPLLELGTGTGRVALPLVAAGYEVTGVDISEPMLRRARGRRATLPRDQAARLHLHRQDVCALRLRGRYAAVLAPFGLLTLLPDASARAACLASCHAHLERGGHIWIDVAATNPDLPALRSFDSHFPLPGGRRRIEKHTVQRRSADGAAVEIEYHYREQTQDQQQADAFVVAFRLALVDEATLLDELDAAQFELLELFGDWKANPSTASSPRLIIEARAR